MDQSLKEFKPLSLNLLQADTGFVNLLNFLYEPRDRDRLMSVLKPWKACLPRWNNLAFEADRPEKLPRVEKYDRVGNRIEKVILPMETKIIRREVVEQGIWQNTSEMEKFSKVYLLAQMGEAGVTCPLACTDGLIRVVEALGTDFLKKEYLPKLKSADYPLAGAQFITEQAGGSDVGAIEGTAKKSGEGIYALTATKWYCSAYDDFFLVAARPEGAPQGTAGIAIFFVPRLLNGAPNNLSIRRLKNKLGTQSLPTAEVDFEGSTAYLLGKPEDGFHHLMNFILNVSRIHNAANSLAVHRRAFAEARNYAEQRVAFGSRLIDFPLIQESLISMLSSLSAKRALFFHMVKMVDDNGLLPADREQRLWQRTLINMMKYRTAANLTEQVKAAILVFGANGIIQDFSVLPRLLRDSLIVETWEGPHNVLCLQIMRDSARFDFIGRFNREVEETLAKWPEGVLDSSRKIYAEKAGQLKVLLGGEALADSFWVQTHARRIVDRASDLLEIGILIRQGAATGDVGVYLSASHLAHSVDSFSGFKNPVIANLKAVALPLIREEPPSVDLAAY